MQYSSSMCYSTIISCVQNTAQSVSSECIAVSYYVCASGFNIKKYFLSVWTDDTIALAGVALQCDVVS